MPAFKTLMDVYKLLEKSNCRKCNEKTCLAFATAVFQGRRPLADCPQVPPEIAQMLAIQGKERVNNEPDMQNQLDELRAGLTRIDLAATAHRVGGTYDGQKLVLKIMGKDFRVDDGGNLYTDIHVHPWVTVPIFNYILYCKGVPVKNQWVPLRELPSGKDWYRLFGQRCEKPLKKIADTYADLFADLVDLFNGQPVDNHYPSDIGVILHPLPLVPLLIC